MAWLQGGSGNGWGKGAAKGQAPLITWAGKGGSFGEGKFGGKPAFGAASWDGPAAGGAGSYKTRMCRHFLAGSCQKESACSFAHDASELQQSGFAAAAPGVVEDRKRPMEDAEEPEAAAKRLKTRMCTHFENGMCSRGENCTFAHGAHELQAPNPAAWAAPADPAWAPAAAPVAGAFKTKLCQYFMAGSCHKEAGCSYAHGTHELGGGAGTMAGAVAGDKYKTALCKYFIAGGCNKGELCTFSHGESQYGAAAQSWAPQPQAWDCPSWQTPGSPNWTPTITWAGKGGKGGSGMMALSNGQPAAAKFKTQMCRYNTEGNCRQGAACSFAHSESEQQVTQEVIPPGKFKTRMCKYFTQGTCQKGDACVFAHGEGEVMLTSA